jgi:hypothetical protein
MATIRTWKKVKHVDFYPNFFAKGNTVTLLLFKAGNNPFRQL